MRKLKPTKKAKNTLRISACYIVKNEEKNLPRSIDSLKTAVDEIVIVDTGSTDSTIEIAESYGAKVIKTTWQDDFSAPRNLAIDNAAGDWIIFLDADEYFAYPERVRNAFERNISTPPPRAIAKPQQNGNSTVDALYMIRIDVDEDRGNLEMNREFYCRAFRNVNYLRYRGLIHENIEHINNGTFFYNKAADDDLIIYHTGYGIAKIEGKVKRNLAIINAEIDRIGLQPRHCMPLVDCYFALGDFNKVLYYAAAFFRSNERPITGFPVFCRKVLYAMYQLKRPVEHMLKILDEAFLYNPNN